MRAKFNTEDLRYVTATFDEGERLGNIDGPMEATFPADPDNTEYADLARMVEAGEVEIAAYTTPVVHLTSEISDRQFGEGLWRDGLISYEDYLGFVGPGTIPPALKAIIDTLPDDNTGNPTPRKVATGLLTGAKTYVRDNPLVDVIRQAQGWTVAMLDEHWRAWSAL